MPSIALKVTRIAPENVAPNEGAGPLFRGNGDIDYLCGNCGFAIVAGFRSAQHVSVESAVCSACGATNEFPAELRS
jgi:hypothetical protein